jgi:hypothetical protein
MFKTSMMLACLCLFASTLMGQFSRQPYRLSDKDVENIIRRIEQQSDRFRSSLDSALDKSRINGSNREDDINNFVKDFYKQTKTLRDRFNDHKSTAADVQSILEGAARIDQFMRRYPLSSRAQDDWSTLKTNLDDLAAAYDVNWRWFEYPNANSRPGRYPEIVNTYPGSATVSGVPYRVSDREVEKLLKRIEDQSDKFRSALDSSLDKSRLNGTSREDDINRFVKDFYEETKKLRDHFDHRKSTSADVQSVLERASSIDDFMRRNRLRRNNADKEWEKLRFNLDELARAYNVTWQWRY